MAMTTTAERRQHWLAVHSQTVAGRTTTDMVTQSRPVAPQEPLPIAAHIRTTMLQPALSRVAMTLLLAAALQMASHPSRTSGVAIRVQRVRLRGN